MATASKEENSTRKAQALYVIRYQSFALLIIPFKTARASGFFSRKNRMLSQANLGANSHRYPDLRLNQKGLHFSMDAFISYKLAQFLTC